jgi:hypothetical protein
MMFDSDHEDACSRPSDDNFTVPEEFKTIGVTPKQGGGVAGGK